MTVERKPSVMGAVLGDYRITGALGGGGMGAVFSATHATTGAPAAVKLLRKELTDNAELVERFFNEARAATRIHHPGIIEVYDFGYAQDGRAFLAMELLEGTTLRARIDQRKRLPEPEAIAIAHGIADALAAAHGAGIIHRDLKPDNVFLVAGDNHAGRVKLLDFGIAKLLDRTGDEASRTRTGSLLGTPVYMAPEQARAAGAIDPRADLYSLGCILYEMVTGAPPFTGNVGELLAAHMFTEPVPARNLAPISVALDALISRLLAKEAADRPRDAGAVVAALDGTSVPTVQVSRGFDDAPPVTLEEKRSAMPIIAAVATLAIAGATLFFVFGRGAADDDPPPAKAPPAKVIAADPPPVVVTPIPTPTVTPRPPPAPPPGPTPVVVVKKAPVVVKRPLEHPPAVDHSTGPVTMPEARTEPPPARPTGPLVTPEGAPLSAAP